MRFALSLSIQCSLFSRLVHALLQRERKKIFVLDQQTVTNSNLPMGDARQSRRSISSWKSSRNGNLDVEMRFSLYRSAAQFDILANFDCLKRSKLTYSSVDYCLWVQNEACGWENSSNELFDCQHMKAVQSRSLLRLSIECWSSRRHEQYERDLIDANCY